MQSRQRKDNRSEALASSVTLEKRLIVERRFREEPKPTRRRKSPILRKCEDLMEALWEDGYRHEISWRLLRDYVIAICGGFRTTVVDYLGRRAKYYRSRGRVGVLKAPARQGYLEKFGFIEKRSPKIVTLHHERVTRPYHNEQTNIVNFSLSDSRKKDEGKEDAMASTNDTTVLLHTQSEREIKKLSQTCQKLQIAHDELRILRSCQRDGRLFFDEQV